ncbi:glycosyltransferase [bacterium 1XD42-8]|nr:glycosyltransferase [bacterium 1XD42-8]
MGKKVWLITHDSYIDRRIYFFADVFIDNGWEVKLFGSNYFEINMDVDPIYVKRPIRKRWIKTYRYSIEDFHSEKIRKIILQIIEEEEAYYKKNGRYTKKFRELGMRINVDKDYRIQIRECGSIFFIIVFEKDKKLVYSSGNQQFQYSLNDGYREYEEALYKYIKDYPNELYVCRDMNGIHVRAILNEWQEIVFEAHRPGEPRTYVYNMEEGFLEVYEPMDYPRLQDDSITEKSYNFVEFKELLYEYSSILYRIKEELKEETPDYIYVADLPTLPIGIMLKESLNCGLMVDCHEWWFQQTILWEGHLKRKIELARNFEEEFYKQCDICITVGKLLAHDMGEYYHKKFYTIYSCMNESLSIAEKEQDRNFWSSKFGIPQESQIAIFQGGLTTLRNLDNLARATKYLKENQFLVIVGDGNYRPEFEKILRLEGKEDRVLFAGWVKQTDLNDYSMNADLGIIPYHAVNQYFAYSVPNKLMEYCETKTPILYDLTMKEIERVVKIKGVGIGADLSNAQDFGKAISDTLNDRELMKNMKKNYEKSENEFGYKIQKKEFEAILKKHYLIE